MKITIVNQFYPPDLSPTGRLAQSLAEHRAALGDDVTIISGQGYARSETQTEEDSNSQPATTTTDEKNRPVVKTIWTPQLGKGKLWKRCADYGCFFLLAAVRLVLLRRQDVVICLTTPPFIVLPAILHKWTHRKVRLVLWNMDCYPEVAERVGAISDDGAISRVIRWVNRRIDARVDHLVCLDQSMKELIESRPTKKGPNAMSVIPNWEQTSRFPRLHQPHEQSTAAQRTVLYTGNMGHGHCFESTLKVAKQLAKTDPHIQFLLVGGGVQMPSLKAAAADLSNINFRDYVREDELHQLQANATCALVTLKDCMLGVMSPSKVHGSLAMGLPILYFGPEGSNVDEAIKRFECGISVRHQDHQHAIDFLRKLNKDTAWRSDLSANARKAFEEAYSDQAALPQFDQVIQRVA